VPRNSTVTRSSFGESQVTFRSDKQQSRSYLKSLCCVIILGSVSSAIGQAIPTPLGAGAVKELVKTLAEHLNDLIDAYDKSKKADEALKKAEPLSKTDRPMSIP
jgi:hypothetical protein